MFPSFSVVLAHEEHSATVADLFNRYRQFYGQESDKLLAQSFISERLRCEESVVFLALSGAEGIGFVQLYPVFSSIAARRAWLLNDLFVAEKWRQQGVGEALIEKARVLGAATNAAYLALETAADNRVAQRLYERLGWQKNEEFYRYELSL